MAPIVSIADIACYDGQEVTIRGWVYLKREKGRLIFILVRDGSGLVQSVVFKADVSERKALPPRSPSPRNPHSS